MVDCCGRNFDPVALRPQCSGVVVVIFLLKQSKTTAVTYRTNKKAKVFSFHSSLKKNVCI